MRHAETRTDMIDVYFVFFEIGSRTIASVDPLKNIVREIATTHTKFSKQLYGRSNEKNEKNIDM
jgi:hypothetical protein